MLIYPSQETKTDYSTPPWATLLVMLVSVVAFFWVTASLKNTKEELRARAQSRLVSIVEDSAKSGELDASFLDLFYENNAVVADPNLVAHFSEEARRAWLNANDTTPPLMQIVNRPPRNLLLALTPHHLAVLLVGLFCLACMGYLLEHQYDPQVILALVVTSGCSWVLLDKALPPAVLPSPLFAWANTVTVFLLVGWMTSPRARITISVRGWFIKTFGWETEVPAFMFLVLFITVYLLSTKFASPYSDSLQYTPLAVVASEAIIFSLFLILAPSRAPRVTITPEHQIELDISKAKVFFDSKQPEGGITLLRAIVINDPNRDQLHSVADLAWSNNELELADQCYRTLLRKVLASNEQTPLLDLVSEMLFRQLNMAGKYIIAAIEIAVKAGKYSQVRKLMPYLMDKSDIPADVVKHQLEAFCGTLLAQKDPDRHALLQVQGWLETCAPQSTKLPEIMRLFQTGARESSLTGHFSPFQRIHRLVEIDLLGISPERVTIQVRGQREQHIPWIAFVGIFGCHISGENRGYRGCLVISFKRKIFACTFTSAQILIRERNTPITFEQTWMKLQAHVPEDLPTLPMKEFPALKSDDGLGDLIEAYINQHCEASP